MSSIYRRIPCAVIARRSRLVNDRRFLVALSEAATRVAPAPPVPPGLRRRHPLSCLPHYRQDTLVELLDEHLDAIDVSRAGKTPARTIVGSTPPSWDGGFGSVMSDDCSGF